MLIYPEMLIRKWIGLFAVVNVYGKTVEVEIDRLPSQYSIDKARRYT